MTVYSVMGSDFQSCDTDAQSAPGDGKIRDSRSVMTESQIMLVTEHAYSKSLPTNDNSACAEKGLMNRWSCKRKATVITGGVTGRGRKILVESANM